MSKITPGDGKFEQQIAQGRIVIMCHLIILEALELPSILDMTTPVF